MQTQNNLSSRQLKTLEKICNRLEEVNDYDTRNSPEWIPFIILTKYYLFLKKHQCWKYNIEFLPDCTRENLLDEIKNYKKINYMIVDGKIVSSWWFGRTTGPAFDVSTKFWNTMTDLEQMLENSE